MPLIFRRRPAATGSRRRDASRRRHDQRLWHGGGVGGVACCRVSGLVDAMRGKRRPGRGPACRQRVGQAAEAVAAARRPAAARTASAWWADAIGLPVRLSAPQRPTMRWQAGTRRVAAVCRQISSWGRSCPCARPAPNGGCWTRGQRAARHQRTLRVSARGGRQRCAAATAGNPKYRQPSDARKSANRFSLERNVCRRSLITERRAALRCSGACARWPSAPSAGSRRGSRAWRNPPASGPA